MSLDSKKATWHKAIPAKILKQFCDSYIPIITKIMNERITEGTFPGVLRLAEVTSVFKKLIVWTRRITERLVFCPIYQGYLKESFTTNLMILWKIKLSSILTGVRKGHSAQHALSVTIEEWKRALDKNMKVGAIFMDLSKALGTLNVDFFWLILNQVVLNQLL